MIFVIRMLACIKAAEKHRGFQDRVILAFSKVSWLYCSQGSGEHFWPRGLTFRLPDKAEPDASRPATLHQFGWRDRGVATRTGRVRVAAPGPGGGPRLLGAPRVPGGRRRRGPGGRAPPLLGHARR